MKLLPILAIILWCVAAIYGKHDYLHSIMSGYYIIKLDREPAIVHLSHKCRAC